MIEPFHEQAGVTLYHGDARVVLNQMCLNPAHTVVITDPPWPNGPKDLLDSWKCHSPFALFASVCPDLARLARRLVIHLGCQSDPRILGAIPESMPFVRQCNLEYSVPKYSGTVLNSGDIAYVFGSHESPDGMTLIPGKKIASRSSIGWKSRRGKGHPAVRYLTHVAWLVANLTQPGDVVLDPFCGSGTTLRAAIDHGRRAVGIEEHKSYCEETVDRLSPGVLFSSDPPMKVEEPFCCRVEKGTNQDE